MAAELQTFKLGSSGADLRYLVKEINATTGELAVANISAATSLIFLLKTPKGELIQKSASFVTDGSDGLLKYSFTSSDLPLKRKDLVGPWQVEPKFTLSGYTGPLDAAQFMVLDCLQS